MTAEKLFERITSDGPQGVGLTLWPAMDPTTLAAGNPVQKGHLHDEVEAVDYSAGVWDCTAFDDAPGPYPVDEYMYLLEGKVEMVLPDGSKETVRAGEAFVIPKGLECQWKMPVTVRKIFMILDGDSPAATAKGVSLSRVTVCRGDFAPVAPVDQVSVRTTHFVNHDARMSVYSESFGAALHGMTPPGPRQIIHVLKGSLTLGEGAEGAETFAAGDVTYIHAGAALYRAYAAGTQILVSECHLPAAA